MAAQCPGVCERYVELAAVRRDFRRGMASNAVGVVIRQGVPNRLATFALAGGRFSVARLRLYGARVAAFAQTR